MQQRWSASQPEKPRGFSTVVALRVGTSSGAAHPPIRMNVYARPRKLRYRAESRRDSLSTTRFNTACVPAPLRDVADERPGADFRGNAEQHARPDHQIGSRSKPGPQQLLGQQLRTRALDSRSLGAHAQLRRWLPRGLGCERREVSAGGGRLPEGATRLDDRLLLAAARMVRAPPQAGAGGVIPIAALRLCGDHNPAACQVHGLTAAALLGLADALSAPSVPAFTAHATPSASSPELRLSPRARWDTRIRSRAQT